MSSFATSRLVFLRRRASKLWTNLPLRLKSLIVISLPLATIVLAAALFLTLKWQKNESETRVRHTVEVSVELQRLFAQLLYSESAARGYILTSQKEFRQQLESAQAAAKVSAARLDTLVHDDSDQAPRLDRLKQAMHEQQSALQNIRETFEGSLASGAPTPPGAVPNEVLLQEKGAMDRILKEYRDMAIAESKQLRQRNQQSDQRNRWMNLAIVGGGAATLLAGLFTVFVFSAGIIHRVQDLERAAAQLLPGDSRLEDAEGSDELDRLARALEATAATLEDQRETIRLSLEGGQIMIWQLNAEDGSIRYQVGAEALQNVNYPAEPLPANVEQWLAAIHADDRERVRAELDRVLAEGGAYYVEYRTVPPSGQNLWVKARGRHYPAEPGKPARLHGILSDVTARKRVEYELAQSQQALQRQTRILESVLESMGDGVVVADERGRFLVFNPAGEQILGRGASSGNPENWAEHYGLFLDDMKTPYPSDALPLQRAMRGESVDGTVLFVRHPQQPDGSWVSVSARPLNIQDPALREQDGALRGGVAVFRDITHEKHTADMLRLAKQEAEQANYAKSEFLSRMSHELRTPLNSILGFAQLLELQSLTPEQSDNVRHVLRGGQMLLELINEVLDLARIEAGRLGLSPEPVRMREALRDALDLVRPLAEQHHIRIDPEIAIRCDRHVLADRQRLKQVLLNLLSNAVKFNRPGGSVVFACEETPDDRLRIEVADTGCGISPEGLRKIFQPFERLNADEAGIEGTGLGLALSRKLMEAMGGSIGAESVPGVGSRFFIELALLEHPADQPESEVIATVSEVGASAQCGTVLYIEDNLSNLRLMERILSYYPGVRLLAAMKGQLGLELAQAHVPDWILLDLHLPDLHGEEMLRQLRLHPKTRHIPVTIVSADATLRQISRLTDSGAREYLTKPLDVRQLLSLLDATMRQVERAKNTGTADTAPVPPAMAEVSQKVEP